MTTCLLLRGHRSDAMRLRSIFSLIILSVLFMPTPLLAKKGQTKAGDAPDLEKYLKEIVFPVGELPLNYSPSRDGAPRCQAEKAALNPYWSMFSKGRDGLASLSSATVAVSKNAAAKRSIETVKKCLNKSLTDTDARSSLDIGFLSLLQGEYAEAIGNFKDILKSEPSNLLAVNGSVSALMLQWKDLSDDQRIDWSKQIAGKVGERMRGAGENITADEFLWAAYLYYISESLSPAMVYIESGLKQYPDNPSLLFGRALIWAAGHEYAMALKDLEILSLLQHVSAGLEKSALKLNAICLASLGNTSGAMKVLEGLIKTDEKDMSAKNLFDILNR